MSLFLFLLGFLFLIFFCYFLWFFVKIWKICNVHYICIGFSFISIHLLALSMLINDSICYEIALTCFPKFCWVAFILSISFSSCNCCINAFFSLFLSAELSASDSEDEDVMILTRLRSFCYLLLLLFPWLYGLLIFEFLL